MPGSPLALQIFEPRYLDMVSACARDETPFGVCLVTDRDAEGAHHARVGTSARITDFHTLDNGLLGITAHGEDRFRIDRSKMRDNGLMVADITWIAEASAQALPPEYAVLGQIVAQFIEAVNPEFPGYENSDLDDAAWVGYRLTEFLPMPLEQKQALLEMEDPVQRLQKLLDILPRFQSEDVSEQ